MHRYAIKQHTRGAENYRSDGGIRSSEKTKTELEDTAAFVSIGLWCHISIVLVVPPPLFLPTSTVLSLVVLTDRNLILQRFAKARSTVKFDRLFIASYRRGMIANTLTLPASQRSVSL